MSDDQQPRIRFSAISPDGLSEIHASAIQITLPSGLSFQIEAEPGRDASAVCITPSSGSEEADFDTFQIEPGAANLFSVNVKRVPKRR